MELREWTLKNSIGLLRDYPRGHIVFKQGAHSHSFYLIQFGSIELQFDGQTRRILKVGDFFGEIGVITGLRRTATATCLENSRLLEISPEEFHKVLKEEPKIQAEVFNKFKARLLHYRTRRDQNMLKTKDEAFGEFLSHFELFNLKAGQVLCKEGEDDGRLYFVLSGKLAVKKSGKKIAERGPGDFVGEISALQLVSRIADVEAMESTELLYCRPESLSHLLKRFPAFDQYLRGLAVKRADETPQVKF